LTICSLGQPSRPRVGRLERDKELGEKRAVGIGAFVTASLFGKHGLDRRIGRYDGADLGHRLHPGLERDGRRHHGPDPEVALLQLGQELGAEPQPETEAQHEKHRGDDCGAAIVADRARQNGLVELADMADHEGLDFLDIGRQQV